MADSREPQLDGRCSALLLLQLDPDGDMQRLHGRDRQHLVCPRTTPENPSRPGRRPGVCAGCEFGREEFQEAHAGLLARRGDERRHLKRSGGMDRRDRLKAS